MLFVRVKTIGTDSPNSYPNLHLIVLMRPDELRARGSAPISVVIGDHRAPVNARKMQTKPA